MKKFILLIAVMLAFLVSPAQISSKKVALGAKGVDSLYNAQTKYYPFQLVTAITQYRLWGIQAYITHSAAPTGTDSTHIWYEGSFDNVIWWKITGVVPKVTGGATYYYADDLVSVKQSLGNGGCIFQPPSGTNTYFYSYYRVAFQHYKPAGNSSVYPTAWISLCKLP